MPKIEIYNPKKKLRSIVQGFLQENREKFTKVEKDAAGNLFLATQGFENFSQDNIQRQIQNFTTGMVRKK